MVDLQYLNNIAGRFRPVLSCWHSEVKICMQKSIAECCPNSIFWKENQTAMQTHYVLADTGSVPSCDGKEAKSWLTSVIRCKLPQEKGIHLGQVGLSSLGQILKKDSAKNCW